MSKITATEFARRAGVTKQTIYLWRKNGVGPAAIDVGSGDVPRFAYYESDVQRWLEEEMFPPAGFVTIQEAAKLLGVSTTAIRNYADNAKINSWKSAVGGRVYVEPSLPESARQHTKLRLSPSQISVYRDCPRKYAHRYITGREPVREDHKLAFGRAWDTASGIWWEHGISEAVAWLVEQAGKIDPVDAAKIAALLKFYAPPRDQFEFVGNQVEATFRPSGVHDVQVLCISDSILRDKRSREIVVREAKTTSREIEGFGPYWQRLQVDIQLGTYWHAFDAGVIYYDVVRVPQIRCCGKDEAAAKKEHGENPSESQIIDAYQVRLEADIQENLDKYYQFRPIWKTDDDARASMEDTADEARRIKHSMRLQQWPRNSGSCITMYGTCPYLDVCSGRADINDPSLFRERTHRK